MPSGVSLTVTTTADGTTGGYYGQVASTGLSVDSLPVTQLLSQAKSILNRGRVT